MEAAGGLAFYRRAGPGRMADSGNRPLARTVAGKRIAAFDPKETTRYLRRLGKIAGRGAIPPIEDYVDIAEGLGMKAMHFRTLMETIEGPCLAKDFATAAQLASCFLQMMARQRHGRARRAPPPSNR